MLDVTNLPCDVHRLIIESRGDWHIVRAQRYENEDCPDRRWFTRGGEWIVDVGWFDEDVYKAQESDGLP